MVIEDLVLTDFKAVDKRDEIRSVFGYLRGDGGGTPIVLDGDKPYGVLNEKALMKSRLDPRTKIDRYVVGTRTLAPDASVEDALEVLATSHLAYAPVTEKGNVRGYVRGLDLLARVDLDATADVVARDVPVLGPDASVGEAVHELHQTGAPILPAIGRDGRFAGVVFRRDVVRLEMDARPDGRQTPAPQIDWRAQDAAGYLVADVERVKPKESFARVMEAFNVHDDGCAVLVDDASVPRGILAVEDAVVAALNALRATKAVARGRVNEPTGRVGTVR